jgi:hypothetical protein
MMFVIIPVGGLLAWSQYFDMVHGQKKNPTSRFTHSGPLNYKEKLIIEQQWRKQKDRATSE